MPTSPEGPAQDPYRALFESMDEAFYLVEVIRDPDGHPIDVRYLDENPASVRLAGTSVRGRTLREINPQFNAEWFDILDRVSQTGTPERFERPSPVTGRWHDYHVFAASEGDGHVGVLSSDVTERKHAQDALRESEERFAKFAESSSDAIWVRDARTYVFQYVSPAVQAVYGVSPEAVLADAELLNILIVPEERDQVSANVARIASGEVITQEYRIQRPADLAIRWIRSTGFPLLDADGRVGRIGAIAQDVTERKLTDETLRQSEERQAFLLKLSDAIRPLDDPAGVREIACRLLGETVGADRVYYVDFATAPGVGLVADDYAVPGLPSLAGRYPVTSFGSTHDRHRKGDSWVVEDVLHAQDIAEHEATYYAERQVIAWVDIPLVRSDQLRAVFCVVQTRPRAWTRPEIGLIEDVADRLWAAIERARAETALRESEERLRMALDAGRMGTWRFDLATGTQQWSEQQFGLFGLDPAGEAPTRDRFLSLVHPDDHRLVDYGPKDLAPDRGLLDAEFRIVRPDGRVRWLVAHTIVRRDENGTPLEMIGLNWDVTDQHNADAALRDSEEGLRMALEAGRMGTYRFDVHTGIEHWDDNEYALLGLQRTDEPPTRELFLSIVHPDDLHLVQYTSDDERPPGTSLDTEFRIVRPDTGEVRHLTAHALARFGPDGKPAELIGINQDVTEERRALEAQRATEERLQQFSRASSDVLWIRDVETLQWEYLSPAFDHIYGLTRQDALRADNFHNWLGFILPEDRDGARAALQRVATGERVAFEYRIRRPDGGVRWLRNTDFPIHDQTGKVTHVAGVGSDVTAMKQAEEHQRFLLSELQHRVRNTLAVIRSIMRRTAETTDSKDDFFTHLDGRIAAFARVQAAVTRNPARGVDLAMLLADEMRLVGAQEGRGLTIEGPAVSLAPKAAETLGLALHELATNAVKHGALSNALGSIDVAWRIAGDEAPQLELDWIEHGGPTVLPPRRKGFGSEILERTLAYELKGNTQMEFRPSGFVCHISVPLAAMSGQGGT